MYCIGFSSAAESILIIKFERYKSKLTKNFIYVCLWVFVVCFVYCIFFYTTGTVLTALSKTKFILFSILHISYGCDHQPCT